MVGTAELNAEFIQLVKANMHSYRWCLVLPSRCLAPLREARGSGYLRHGSIYSPCRRSGTPFQMAIADRALESTR